MTMRSLQETYYGLVCENWEQNRADNAAVSAVVREAAGRYGEEGIEHLYIPKMFTPEAADRLREIADTIFGIFVKVTAAYRQDTDFRRLFSFSKELEELMLLPALYACPVPITRVDLFLNEHDLSFQFCEFNTDGSSAMNEDRQLCELLARTDAWKRMEERYELRPFELFDSWVDAFLSLYRERASASAPLPYVAIVDFLESASLQEFEVFREHFARRGCGAEVCEIRSLRYRDGALYTPQGRRIDAVYRRAVTGELMRKKEQIPDFLQAVRDGAVCLIGSFMTQLVHDKNLFVLLRHSRLQRFLTEREQAFIEDHVPLSLPLRRGEFDPKTVCGCGDWIIKPLDAYGGRGVWAGADCTDEQWRKLLEEKTGEEYLLQAYVRPYRTQYPDFTSPTPLLRTCNNLTGLYLYNGQWAGVYSRAGEQNVISALRRELALASVVAYER